MAERDLERLWANLAPSLEPGEFVFCHLPDAGQAELVELRPLASFMEAEGLSLILSRESAGSAGLDWSGTYRLISLGAYSSLDAVGLTARVSAVLAEAGIPANVVAAYHHDHVFVPTDMAEQALGALRDRSG